MSYAEQSPTLRPMSQQATSLAHEWRKLTRAATLVAVLTSPAWFIVFRHTNGWSVWLSLLLTFVGVVAFRGLIDVLAHKLIPRANLYGAGDDLLEQDVVSRRRVWYWRTKYRRLVFVGGTLLLLLTAANLMLRLGGVETSLFGTIGELSGLFVQFLPTILILGLQLPLLFFINFAILFGPLLFFGIKQM